MLVGGGCTDKLVEKAVEKGLENRINAESDANADVDIHNGQVTLQNEDGSVGTFGAGVKLPDDFPSDVPLPKDVEISGVANADDGVWVSYMTEDSVNDIAAWYQGELEGDGWTQDASFTMGSMTTFAYKKDNVTIGVMITHDEAEQDSPTIVMITRGEE